MKKRERKKESLYHLTCICHLPSAICHLPSAIFHLPSAICHHLSPSAICHLPSTISLQSKIIIMLGEMFSINQKYLENFFCLIILGFFECDKMVEIVDGRWQMADGRWQMAERFSPFFFFILGLLFFSLYY